MNKTIILGNGFDINLGLPTRYSQFIASNEFKLQYGSDGLNHSVNSDEHQANLFRHIYMKANSDERWTDIEKILSDYAKSGFVQYMTKRGPKTVPNVSNAEIYRYYESLKDSLKKYIAGILYPMYIDRKSLAYNLLSSISRYPYGDMSVISFNYTIPSSFLPELDLSNKIYNVHGDINSDIILGFNNSGHYDSSYDYMVKSQEPGNRIEMVQSRILSADELLVFGHSLGESDRDYFRDILPSFSKRVIFITYDEMSKQSMIGELNDMNAYSVINNSEWYFTSQDNNLIVL